MPCMCMSSHFLLFDRIVRTILEPSAGKSGGAPCPDEKVATSARPERWCSGSIDRRSRSPCVRHHGSGPSARDRLCGQLVILSSRRARLRERQHTGQVSAPPVATAIDRDDKTEQHVLRRRPRDRHAHGPREVDPPKRHVSRHRCARRLGLFRLLADAPQLFLQAAAGSRGSSRDRAS